MRSWAMIATANHTAIHCHHTAPQIGDFPLAWTSLSGGVPCVTPLEGLV